jgi:MGT family glycosyltransferase
MARFLATTWPFAGHIHPNIAIASALRARGHEVAFYTGAAARPSVEGEGFACFSFGQVDEARVNWLITSPEGILSHPPPRRLKAMWREWVLESVPAQLADLEPILDEWRPDAIICDPAMWAPYLILHEARRLPVAIFTLVAACLLPGRDGPIPGFPLPRPRTLPQRLRAAALRRLAQLFLADVRRGANALRRARGLAPIGCSVTQLAGRMPLYLVPSSRMFDYQRDDLPPSVHYVGPCLWSKPAGQEPPRWLAESADRRPLVYATEGTINLQPRILKAAAQGLAGRDLRVLMTIGRHRELDELDLGPLPLAANIRVEQWVALDDLLPHAAAVITTGGPSTVLAALLRGLPLVIVPSDWDHPETAWRVVDAGAGLRVAPEDCAPERLREATERVLREPAFRANARRLGESLASCGGPSRAAELLEGLVEPRAIEYGTAHAAGAR